MLKNKKKDMTPYNMSKRPIRQNPALLPLIWAGSYLMTRTGHLNIQKKGMEHIQPPYLVLAQHQGFTDYYIAPLALFPHRANYLSDVEGFAAFGNHLYQQIGCLPTRRFVGDISVIRNIQHVVEHNRNSIVIFPEARHSNVGTNSLLPASVGKLVKLLKIPVVLLKSHGSYLTAPIWDESHRRKVPLSVTLELVLTPDEIKKQPAAEIIKLLNQAFVYDEYRWQYENKISITYPKRAEGLHKVLYQCPVCNTEYSITSKGSTLTCLSCHACWDMDEYGRLLSKSASSRFPHIPDWYEFQRRETIRQINDGTYYLHEPVSIDALPNEKGFVPLGDGCLTHNKDGFRLEISSCGCSKLFSSAAMCSVHTEYDYRGKGDCIVLSTKECCYYLYFHTSNVNVTKIQFAAEYFHYLKMHPISPESCWQTVEKQGWCICNKIRG